VARRHGRLFLSRPRFRCWACAAGQSDPNGHFVPPRPRRYPQAIRLAQRSGVALPMVEVMWNLSRGWRSPVRYAVLLAVAVGAGSLTAGCQGGSTSPSPSVSASHSGTASPSASSSASPSPSPSYSVPPEARTHDEAGAMAFVRFYIEQVNRAWTTPDDKLLPPLIEPECKSCKAMQDNAVEYVSLKHRYATPAVEITNLVIAPGSPDGQQFLSFKYHQLAANVIDKDGTVISTKAESSGERRVLLTWKGDRWSVSGIG